ncbi:putative deoxyribonuclease RhsB [Pelotomaculum sp. FP]|uniref:RHS repeat domain-containing protein n=1 Tax=Pelotomaculum sp. FP TaxID=261474 RepID=UPI001065DCFC|nr:RHS repeat domain-containing protein [Pelotomaculum sp. FP]TEB09803.1 putative deoxyribonuclease RhsB [Pelotomaculum sp. FP]
MEKDIKPIEEGNAEIKNEKCHPIMFPMLQYGQIASYYTEEPLYIRAKRNKGDKLNIYEQILRMRYTIPNDKINSWCVYSEEREYPFKKSRQSGLIIRNVIWDRKHDTIMVKANPSIKEQERWPTIYIKNIYLNPDKSEVLIEGIKEFDQFTRRGIILKKRNSKEHPLWLDLEVMRWFDWGQVKTTWSPYEMVNHEIGNLINISLPNGKNINYTYDNANRLTQKTLDGGRYFNYGYDGANNLTSVVDNLNKSYSWVYDGAGRVTSSTDPFNITRSYRWDKGNNLTSNGFSQLQVQ